MAHSAMPTTVAPMEAIAANPIATLAFSLLALLLLRVLARRIPKTIAVKV